MPLSVQNHSRSCFHVDFVQCDSCLEIIYDMLKWPCEKNLGLKRCCVANSLSGNHRVLACGRHSVVVDATVSSNISVVSLDNIFKR